MEYTAIVKQIDEWWVGWVEEIPGVNCQERTHLELLKSLRNTLREAIDLNKLDAIEQAGENYKEEIIAV